LLIAGVVLADDIEPGAKHGAHSVFDPLARNAGDVSSCGSTSGSAARGWPVTATMPA